MQYTIIITILLFALQLNAVAQKTIVKAHSHNDYKNEIPFRMAYSNHFGSIEVDVFEKNGQLYVAHEQSEISELRTLDSLYLQPVEKTFRDNGNKAWSNNKGTYQLMIELKSSVEPALSVLCKKISQYADVFDWEKNPDAVHVVITGNTPLPADFSKYPTYISFDGTINQTYTPTQLNRIGLFSQNLNDFTNWNGKGSITVNERKRLVAVIDSVHSLNKEIRFWNTADHINTWKTLMDLGVDYINTDRISALANYLSLRDKSLYTSTEIHQTYTPTYRTDIDKGKIKNVILLIGDGMGVSQLYAGYTANRGDLNIFKMRNIGFSKTNSADSYNTDSAAGGTAIATGKKTNNRSVGCDAAQQPINSIPEIVIDKGIWSGIVTVGDATDATPAAFYAHQTERSMSEKIALDLLNSPVRVLIGGNQAAFTKRSDGRNLPNELETKGFSTSFNIDSAKNITNTKLLVLDDKNTCSKIDGRGEFLTDASQIATQLLSKSPNGFFLMVEGTQIDWGGHQNNMQYVVREQLDFDKAVGEALRFADNDGQTLVIVTADHECGGLTILDGNYTEGTVDGQFSTNDHTGIMVPVFAYGPYASEFSGVYENTEVFNKIIELLKATQKSKK